MQMTNSLKKFLINCESSQKFTVTHKIKSISSIPHIPIVCSATPLSVPRNRCFTVSDGRPLSIPGDTDGRLSRVNAPNIAHRKFKEEYKYKIHKMQIHFIYKNRSKTFHKGRLLRFNDLMITLDAAMISPCWAWLEIWDSHKLEKGLRERKGPALLPTVCRRQSGEYSGRRERRQGAVPVEILVTFIQIRRRRQFCSWVWEVVRWLVIARTCCYFCLSVLFLYFVFLHFEYARGSWVR